MVDAIAFLGSVHDFLLTPNLAWISGLLLPLRIYDFFSQGLNILIPVLDRIRYVQSLKEIVINVPEQSAVTLGERHRVMGMR